MKKHFRQTLSLIMSLMMIMSIFAGLEISSFAEETVCDHSFVITDRKTDPTCHYSGYTEGEFCIDCEKYISGHDEIPKSEHTPNLVALPGSVPSCMFNGYEPGEYCIACNEWVSGHEEIAPNGKHSDSDNDYWCDCCMRYNMASAMADSVKIFSSCMDYFIVRVAFAEKYKSVKAEIYYDEEKLLVLDTWGTDQTSNSFSCELSHNKISVSTGILYWDGSYEPAILGVDYELLAQEPTDVTVKVTEINGKPADISDVITIYPQHIYTDITDCQHTYIWSKDSIKEPSCFESGYTNGTYCDGCNTWFEGRVEIPAFETHVDEDLNFTCDRCLKKVDINVYDIFNYGISNKEAVIFNVDNTFDKDCIVPDSIEGYPVTTITAIDWEYDAFKYSKIKSITLPESIKKIDADVFYGCAYLENIYYNGSQEQWNEIEIDESNTEKLTLTTIHFNSTGPDNPTTEYVYDAESVELNQTNVELPENRIKKLNLPFAWEDVEAYNFDGKYAMFLTIDNATASIIEEHEYWAEYSHIINYKLYYTEDFSEFKTTEYTVDTNRYIDIPDSDCLYAPLGVDSTDPDKIPHYYGYKITNINDDKYFINASAWGDVDYVFGFGVVFDNGEISLLDPEVNGNIFVPYDDCYILIDSIMNTTITDLELIEYDADSSTPTFKYNLKVAPTYCYSEDLKNWTKIIGGAEHKLHHTSYTELNIGDTVGGFKYFECDVYSNNILCVRFRPSHPQMVSNQPFGNANVTYNGKNFICLDKIFEYEKTSTFWQYDGAIYGVNSIYSSDTISYGYSNIVKYDLDGKVISEQKLKFNEDWDAGIAWSVDNFEYTVSLKNSDKEFINSLTFRINEDSELKIYETDFDMTGVIGGASMNLKDGKTVFMLFDDSICLRSESEPYNLKFIPVERDYTNIEVFGSTVFLFADDIYAISEPVIQAIVSGDELPEEPTEDGNLDVKGEGGIVTDFENKISQIGKEVTIETLSSMIENENFAIVDKNGKALSEKALVGTGSKIQILDKDGKVLNEYTILVPTDIDGNGKTTAADARLALRASAQLDTLEGVYATAADAVDDDKITASDARKILRISAGMEE